jgi:hypothetical protein
MMALNNRNNRILWQMVAHGCALHPKSVCWNLITNVIRLADETFGKCLGNESGVLMNGSSALQKGIPGS